MNVPFYISRRLSLSQGGHSKAPAVWVAIAAVALSFSVMLASVAIVLGFKEQIRNKVVGFNAHITIYPTQLSSDDDNVMQLTPELTSFLDSIPFIVSSRLMAAAPAILKTDSDFKGIYLKGSQDDLTQDFLKENLEEGEIFDFKDPDNREKILLSRTAARELGLKAGDKVNTYFLTDDLRVRKLMVSGIYNSHFSQYDDVLAFGVLPLVQKISGLNENEGTYMQLMTDDFGRIEEYALNLQNAFNRAFAEGRLGTLYRTESVISQGAGFFNWLSLLDTNVIVVLTLMIVVGCVTLISGMLMIILEKKRLIGILKALGTPSKTIRNVFLWLALRIAVWGLAIGNCVAIGSLLFQEKTRFLPLDAESYYIDFVPVKLTLASVLVLNVGVLAVMYISLVLPSRLVAGISPAETMRGE